MKKEGGSKKRVAALILTVIAVFIFFLVIIPAGFLASNGSKVGNVAIIPIEGPISTNGGDSLGQKTVSSASIIKFIEEAEQNSRIKVIVLEINSPGGSAVASDEIASAVKRANKPVVAQIREVGASGGYWIASAADHIIANKMSITGSIGVISSYLDFSGLLEQYNISYRRLVAGRYKDMGTALKPLQKDEQQILQEKLDKIHRFFIQEVALNRGIPEEKVKKIATGEFFLGAEALDLELVDGLGDKNSLENYIKDTYRLEEINPVRYEEEVSFFQMLTGIAESFSFQIGKGIGSILTESGRSSQLLLN